jgi:translation initiation factor 1
MPFNIAGDWIPNPSNSKPTKPVKVRLVKRGKSILTVILNLSMSEKELGILASQLKKKLGCGGAVKDDNIEIQGDKVSQVLKLLSDLGIKAS